MVLLLLFSLPLFLFCMGQESRHGAALLQSRDVSQTQHDHLPVTPSRAPVLQKWQATLSQKTNKPMLYTYQSIIECPCIDGILFQELLEGS